MSFRNGRDFSPFVALSAILHALMLLGLAIAGPGFKPSAEGYGRFDQTTLNALQERWSRERAAAEEHEPFPGDPDSEKGMSSTLRGALERLRFDDDVNEADRISIAERLLRTASQMAPENSSAAERDFSKEEIIRHGIPWIREEDGMDVVAVGSEFLVRKTPPDFKAAIDRFRGDTSHAALSIDGGLGVLVPSGEGPKEVPAEYFFRASPFREMAAVGADLFPALRELAASEQAGSNSLGLANKAEDRTAARIPSGLDSGIVFITLQPTPTISAPGMRAALTIGGPEIDKVLDRLMALDVERQLEGFEWEFLEHYDWKSSGLALLTREFVFRNLNGIFFVLDDLALNYDRLEELFYKRPVFEAFKRWAGRFPGTPTDSEISFYFISELDFELRAFRSLLASGEAIDAVLKGNRKAPTMYQARAKAATLGRIRSDLLLRLKQLGLSPEQLIDSCLLHEQDILSSLAGRGGETRNRALVRWGELLWRERDYEAAVARWKMVDLNCRGYSRSFGRALSIISRYGANSLARRDIEDRLYAEDAIGRADRLERQLRFHLWARRSARYGAPSPPERP
jgi:hypothetical protein